LINLSREPALIYKGYRLPKILFDDYVLINIPKIKTNDLTIVTCSLKNLFGLLPSRHRAKYHNIIDQVIVDLNKIFRSNLIIVDGLVGMEGDGPIKGLPVNMNIVVAGNNPVAVDSVICRIIGVNPKNITHIDMAKKAALGQIDINSMELLGEELEDVKRKFALPSRISLKRKLKYMMLEHSESAILKQSLDILKWWHKKKYLKEER